METKQNTHISSSYQPLTNNNKRKIKNGENLKKKTLIYLNSQKISIKSTRTFFVVVNKNKKCVWLTRTTKKKNNNNNYLYMYDRSTHSSLSKVTHT